MRQWYLNSWGYWVLYAKAGQIFLNVPNGSSVGGRMEGQGDLEATALPWLDMARRAE